MVLATLFFMLTLFCGKALAQGVTISPATGNVIAAVSSSEEKHMSSYGGMWIHNQLPLDLITSDNPDLTSVGLPSIHANNIRPIGNNKFVMCGGSTNPGYFTLSLPKGYRFTSYKMVITNNVSSSDISSVTLGTGAYGMKEYDGSFSGTELASVNLGTRNTSNSTQYYLQRTASLANDMGNVLYFALTHTSGQYAAVYLEMFEVTFECDKNFTVGVTPTATISTGVDCVEIPFDTDRMDLGAITWTGGTSTGSSNKAFRYNYTNLKNLQASLQFYNEDAISAGTASPSTVGAGNIKSASDGTHYALQNDVYYIETPTDAVTQNNINIPVGYRITGARLHYANAVYESLALGKTFYITDGNGNYMNTSLKFTSTPVLWSSTTAGKVYSGSTYLRVTSSGIIFTTYSLSTTNSSSSASTFVLDADHLYYSTSRSNYYITATGTVSTSSSETRATLVSGSAGASSTYTLKLYGTDANTVEQQVTVNAENASGELEVALLNNDALKFEVSDLTGDAAYVWAELVLENLDPYVSRSEVVGTVRSGEKTIRQSYLANDFTIGEDGLVHFVVPDNFASGDVKISFDQLTHKNADDTYGDILGGDGYSRYHYVKSEFYNTIDEDIQSHRDYTLNTSYTKKVLTEVTGTQAFTCNNSEEFKVDQAQDSKTYYYTEYRYSNAEYEKQGGQWVEVTLTRENPTKDCYLVTCDVPRYNIAPTTTPRHAYYAYYTTKVTLEVADYEPKLTYVKVYDDAMLQGGYDQNAYYGVKVNAKYTATSSETGDVPTGTGYLFAKQILDQMNKDIASAGDGMPKDGKHILYMDASDLNTILSSADDADQGKIADIQALMGANALCYMPPSIAYTLNNQASKTASGDYKAENNILLVDKQPFFAPYPIRVDASCYTQYTRLVTYNYGKSNYITLCLPFAFDLTGEATHTNFQGGSSIKLYTMQLTNAISSETGTEGYDYGFTGHFTPVSGTLTEGNKPYLAHIESFEEGADDQTSIIVRQNGASILQTPTDANGLGTSIDGETASGKIGTSSATFTQHASFNGDLLKTGTGPYFYFAKNRFVLSTNLPAGDQDVYNMPFRGYYTYTGPQNAKYMNISLEPNGDATAIGNIISLQDRGFALSADGGTLQIAAGRDISARITTLTGQTVMAADMPAGTTRTLTLPAGVYMVNGVKVLVK